MSLLTLRKVACHLLKLSYLQDSVYQQVYNMAQHVDTNQLECKIQIKSTVY